MQSKISIANLSIKSLKHLNDSKVFMMILMILIKILKDKIQIKNEKH